MNQKGNTQRTSIAPYQVSPRGDGGGRVHPPHPRTPTMGDGTNGARLHSTVSGRFVTSSLSLHDIVMRHSLCLNEPSFKTGSDTGSFTKTLQEMSREELIAHVLDEAIALSYKTN